ncbi:MAG: hypothetical protein KAS36_07465, partial [Anaerolineales bacterium]|nr:hypothetical protein [Anaerolineales bacterium]
YLDPIPEISRMHTPSYVRNVFKGEPIAEKFSQLSHNRFRLEIQKGIGAICDIMGVPRATIMRVCPQHIRFYDYIYEPYNKIVAILEREMRWSDAHGTVEHLDCVLHGIPLHMHTFCIPGITPETCRSSALIRQGILKRQNAMEIENQYNKNLVLPEELEYFLKQTGMTYREFRDYATTRNGRQYEPRLQKTLRKTYYKLRRL